MMVQVRLTGGDLTRILLAMDDNIKRAAECCDKVKIKALEEHHDRLVVTRNKLQRAWASLHKPPKPRRKR